MSDSDKSEHQLLSRISQSDERAFREFFDLYYPRLINYAYYILEIRYVSEEIVSGVFIKLWENRKAILNIKNIKPYLFVSVKNLSLNYLRDNKKLMISEPDGPCFEMIRSMENPESDYIAEELRIHLVKSIDNLPQRCKMIFTLIREDHMKYQEVADLLDISIKTVEVQMGRAMAKLKVALINYRYDEESEKIAAQLFA